MEQDSNLEKIREYARTTVLNQEQETEDVVENKIDFRSLPRSSTPNLETSKKENVSPLTAQVSVAKECSVTLKRDEKKLEELKNKIQKEQENKLAQEKTKEIQTKQEEKQVERADKQLDNLFAQSLEIKETHDKQLEQQINESSVAKPKNYKFRFRLLGCVFACLVALTGGWIIGNIVEISKTSVEIAQVTQKNSEYSVNIAQLLNKISKIETGETKPNSPSDGSLLPIEEVIPITPQPLEDVTEYEQHSNWFDKICNWLKNLFGG